MRLTLAIASVTFFSATAVAQNSPDPATQYQQEILEQPRNSLAHYRLGEVYFRAKDYVAAANEFRAALNGDGRPRWTATWSHIQLANIFNLTGQGERAANEYRLAETGETRAFARTLEAAEPVQGIVRPKRLDDPVPEYTDEARIAGLEGEVVLNVTVGAAGELSDIEVVSPLGLGLDERAVEAVKRCHFESGTRNGVAVAMKTTVSVNFLLPTKLSRWHLLRAQFRAPAGATRAIFRQASYPSGAGISATAIDEGRLLGAIGRQGTATISFDVDERGEPSHFQVDGASLDLWANEAISLVREWHFVPGVRDGRSVAVPCTLDLAWGQRRLTAQAIKWANTSLRSAKWTPTGENHPIIVLSASEWAYTPEALQARVEGTVTMQLLIADDGSVRDAFVLQPLGYGLDEKAIEMVREHRFSISRSNTQADAAPETAQVMFYMTGPGWEPRH